MKRLSDEELAALVQYYDVNAVTGDDDYDLSGWDVSDVYKECARFMAVMPRLLTELRDLRALLATPMPQGHEFLDEQIEIVDGLLELPRGWLEFGRVSYVEPDEGIALGAALINAGLAAKEGAK